MVGLLFFFVFSSRRRHTRSLCDWSSDVCSSDLGLPTQCYAVDTWEGDEHTGAYGPEILEELRAHHDPLYGSFSRLLRQTFDEAAEHFVDGSVDLLHVDGCHGYDAVAHDLETWLPKLGEGGVVLLHDTNVREPGFGVWRLWDELSSRYPGFAFPHGHGLGVLAVGSRVDAQFLDFLAAAERDPLASRFFATLGSRIALPMGERRARAAAEHDAEQSRRAASEARAELDAQRSETERLQFERDRLEVQLRAREADLARVVHSISWRLTAPLRAAKRDARRARRVVRRLRRPTF